MWEYTLPPGNGPADVGLDGQPTSALGSRTSADHGMKGPLTTMDSALRTEIDMPATASAIELTNPDRHHRETLRRLPSGYGRCTRSCERAITLRAGVRLKSSVDTTEVLVVRAPAAPSIVRCGGEPMYAVADSSPSEPTDSAAGVRPGQWLRSEGSVEFEVLVLRGGFVFPLDRRPSTPGARRALRIQTRRSRASDTVGRNNTRS